MNIQYNVGYLSVKILIHVNTLIGVHSHPKIKLVMANPKSMHFWSNHIRLSVMKGLNV